MTRNNNNYNIYSESNREKRTKRIVMIIIIIFIILFLITSCSCTAKFWGKIGDLFVNEMDVDIDKDRNDLEPIVNRELHFDFDQDGIENKYDFDYEMYVTDEDGKVTYSYFDISPHEFSCTTSDAAIATCYVKKDYVVIRPKKIGNVEIILETKTNGKLYQAKLGVSILDANRYIRLSNHRGTIYLDGSRVSLLTYTLVGLSGKVTVTVGNEDIASVTVEDGVLKVTGKKAGKTDILIHII